MAVKNKEKNITLNDLARMVKVGFDEVYKRFDGVDKRFDKIDKRFRKIDGRFDEVWMKLHSLERRIIAIEDILVEHAKRLRGIEQGRGRVGEKVKSIKKEIKAIKAQKKIDNKRILNLEKRIEKLELKYA